MKILITRGGGTGPTIPRQRILYEYCANSSKFTWKIRKKLIWLYIQKPLSIF